MYGGDLVKNPVFNKIEDRHFRKEIEDYLKNEVKIKPNDHNKFTIKNMMEVYGHHHNLSSEDTLHILQTLDPTVEISRSNSKEKPNSKEKEKDKEPSKSRSRKNSKDKEPSKSKSNSRSRKNSKDNESKSKSK